MRKITQKFMAKYSKIVKIAFEENPLMESQSQSENQFYLASKKAF